MKFILKRDFDLLCASLALALGLTSSVIAYANILRIEEPKHVFVSSIPLGETKYIIKQVDRCVGNIMSHLIHDSIYQWESHGQFNSTLKNKDLSANFRLLAYFNPLGQLSESEFSVTSNTSTIILKTSGANPISADLTARLEDKIFTHKFDIPGPLTITKKARQEFQLEYQHLKTGSNSNLEMLGNFTPNLNVKVLNIKDPEATCAQNEPTTLDLSPLFTQLQFLLAPLTNLMPPNKSSIK